MAFALLVLGYLCGSVSSAILVCRVLGHADPRTAGSRNPGTTNVLRLYGRAAAAMTLFGDVAKGTLPVVAATWFDAGAAAVALAGFGAFLGHLYPVFFRFEGGKGVATLIGVLLGFSPWLGAGFIATWLAVAALTRYSSLSALTATAFAPVIALGLGAAAPIVGAIAAMGVFVFWRHRANIKKLLDGTEDKIGGARSGG